MSDNLDTQGIVDPYPELLFANYCILASSVLLWFDIALTFATEERRIWRRKFSGATVVYFCTRYIALFERIFALLISFLWRTSDITCGSLNRFDFILTSLNYNAVSAFTILRVYGVWERNWRPLLLVVPLALVKPVLHMIRGANYVSVQSGPPHGCLYFLDFPDQTLEIIAQRSTTIAADAILVGLTWFKTFGMHRTLSRLNMPTSLSTILLRDGTAYFIVLLLITITIIVSQHWNSALLAWRALPYFEQTLSVILLSRIMLNLRGVYFDGVDSGHASTPGMAGFSDIQFARSRITSHIVGNLGAPLGTRNLHRARQSLSFANSGDAQERDRGELNVENYWDEPYEEEEVAFASDPFTEGMELELALDMQRPPESAPESKHVPCEPRVGNHEPSAGPSQLQNRV